jgi:hypothetical protein
LPPAPRGKGEAAVAVSSRERRSRETQEVLSSRCAVVLLDTHVDWWVLDWIRSNPGGAKCKFVVGREGYPHVGLAGLSSNTCRYTCSQTKPQEHSQPRLYNRVHDH